MKIILVAGARPNFMKIAPLMNAIKKYNLSLSPGQHAIQPILVHTGQHYDYQMSQVFFQELEIPAPDVYLNVGSGTHGEQTGKVLIEFEKTLLRESPDLVIVVGDVNSTLAAALAAVKLHIPVAHVEAGLRSFDRAMPEEINRLLTDAVSDYLFTPSPDADENLKKEGVPTEKIFMVGDVMIDSLIANQAKAAKSEILSRLGLNNEKYALLTLHRPSNVDQRESLVNITNALKEISVMVRIVFSLHPRTRKNLTEFGLTDLLNNPRILCTEPLGYLDFLKLEMSATLVLTDSGSLQQETTYLQIPCLTLRENTERPITITQGTNILVGNDPERIITETRHILKGRGKKGACPELWDGNAAEKILTNLVKCMDNRG